MPSSILNLKHQNSTHARTMDSDLTPLAEELEDNLDDLTDIIQPLLNTPLTDAAAKLPLVDKAKLHVLDVYAFESLLFCTTCPTAISPPGSPY